MSLQSFLTSCVLPESGPLLPGFGVKSFLPDIVQLWYLWPATALAYMLVLYQLTIGHPTVIYTTTECVVDYSTTACPVWSASLHGRAYGPDYECAAVGRADGSRTGRRQSDGPTAVGRADDSLPSRRQSGGPTIVGPVDGPGPAWAAGGPV